MSSNVRTVSVKVARLPGAKDLPLPAYKTAGAAGMDLYAAVPADEPVTLSPGARAAIPTGLQIAVPQGYEAQVRARSGLAKNHGIAMVNGPGTIDCDYRGEICVIMINTDAAEPFRIQRGDRIAQMIVAPVAQVEWEEQAALSDSETERGAGGFGSTGK
ncbi:MAG: dUTP diphosphatase [Armatimonadota bacterium]